jgi:hypothetical protein
MLVRAVLNGSAPEETETACSFVGSNAAMAAPMGMRNLLYVMGEDYIPLISGFLAASNRTINTRILLILGCTPRAMAANNIDFLLYD